MTRSADNDLAVLLERASEAIAGLHPAVSWPQLAGATDLPVVLAGAAALLTSLQLAAARLQVYLDGHAASSALGSTSASEQDPALQAAAAELGQASELSEQLADVLSAAAEAVNVALGSDTQ